ncbi:AEC family transporter [Carnobacteriaceae bacterium zg-C25]|nr:AEC family transporter [Carnobacteriaceae bacterium zg-ZUI240]QTU82578.1 AEC family transporter [Carnobacteriaceae bacterium zg-C25]
MNFFKVLQDTLSNQSITTAIVASLAIILLGFYLRRKGTFTADTGKVLTHVALSVSIPALAFRSFLVDIKKETFQQGINILIWGFLIYILLIFVTMPLFAKFKGNQQDTLRMLSIFGSTTFFGLPIVSAIYGAEGALYGSIFNIGYRVFLYSYCYIKMSGLKVTKQNLKTMFLNPIVIATFLGLFIWIFQANLPQVAITAKNASGQSVVTNYAFLRLDKTAPQLYQILTYLQALASPLAWLAIGSTLGSIDFKQAMSDKVTWYATFVKLLVLPALNLLALVLLTTTHILPVNLVALATTIIMVATPPATVAVAYAINFDKDAILASNFSLLGTVAAVIAAPIWIVVIQIIGSLGIF